MTDELERIWEGAVMAELKYYPDICLEGYRTTVKNIPRETISAPSFKPRLFQIRI
jgi:hypothetical protein